MNNARRKTLATLLEKHLAPAALMLDHVIREEDEAILNIPPSLGYDTVKAVQRNRATQLTEQHAKLKAVIANHKEIVEGK